MLLLLESIPKEIRRRRRRRRRRDSITSIICA